MFFILLAVNLIFYIASGIAFYDFYVGLTEYSEKGGLYSGIYLLCAICMTIFILLYYKRRKNKRSEKEQKVLEALKNQQQDEIGTQTEDERIDKDIKNNDKKGAKKDSNFLDFLECAFIGFDADIFDCNGDGECDSADCDAVDFEFIDCSDGIDCVDGIDCADGLDCASGLDCSP